jgi:dethiobiotin synthetase
MSSQSDSPAFSPAKALFITGTDTNVGKTHVACLIARQLRSQGHCVGAYKPVCSGAVSSANSSGPIWDDIERLKSATDARWADEIICPQRFLAPLAPPVAARLEGRTVDFDRLVVGASQFPGADLLLIEGAGGWLSPLTNSQTVADLAQEIGVPILIVARLRLGTINHTLLTIEAIRSRGLEIGGVILNETDIDPGDLSTSTNADEIESRSGVPVLGIVPHGSRIELLRHGSPVTMDWCAMATLPRAWQGNDRWEIR